MKQDLYYGQFMCKMTQVLFSQFNPVLVVSLRHYNFLH